MLKKQDLPIGENLLVSAHHKALEKLTNVIGATDKSEASFDKALFACSHSKNPLVCCIKTTASKDRCHGSRSY